MIEQLIVPPTTYTKDVHFPDPSLIEIYDTTLRDGEQTPRVAFSPDQKCEIAIMASRLGCHIVEMGFPASDESDCEALRMALRLRRGGAMRQDLQFSVLCRAHPHDIEQTVRAIESAGAEPSAVRICVFTSGSDLHIRHKLSHALAQRAGISTVDGAEVPLEVLRRENMKMIQEAVGRCRSLGFEDINFGAEDSSRATLDQLMYLAGAAFDAGATRYVLADTTGSLSPESTRIYFGALRDAFPGRSFGCHLHNDFDLATINTIIACQLGATELTVTMNGIGERAGNTPIHALLVALRELYGVTIPGFRYDLLSEASRLVERLTGIPISPTEPVIGENIFTHESGIHAHGVLAHPLTYEPFSPDTVGAQRNFVFGKHSGRRAVRHALEKARARLEKRAIEITEDLVSAVIGRLKAERLRRAEAGAAEHGMRIAHDAFHRLGFSDADVVVLAERLASTPHAEGRKVEREPAEAWGSQASGPSTDVAG